MKRQGRSFSTSRHRRQTQTRLILGGLLVLLGVGGGLVWLIYGSSAAVIAVACLLGAAGIFGLLWLILTLLELWVKEEEP
jgi:protein-S-isoprenylcysteine O-methyltransferase Ste14